MQINEPFTPTFKGTNISSELYLIKADVKYLEGYVNLTLTRNPEMDREELLIKSRKEIEIYNTGVDYGLYFALKDDQIVGICRFFTSQATPKEKVKYKHPSGMYCMGIIVHPDFRRKGIAAFLSNKRIDILKKLGLKEAFSIVATDNLTSIKMHEKFGFKEVERGPGFFTVHFDCGEGILFKKCLK